MLKLGLDMENSDTIQNVNFLRKDSKKKSINGALLVVSLFSQTVNHHNVHLDLQMWNNCCFVFCLASHLFLPDHLAQSINVKGTSNPFSVHNALVCTICLQLV